jgi:hydroxymethylpyrimidine/phosphomethylpyrimidine kinase
MTDYTIAQLDAMIADLQFRSDADSHTICSVAAQLRASLAREAKLRGALEKALNFIQNTESEFGTTLHSGDVARAALGDAS